VGHVQREVPPEILRLDRGSVQVDFETAVPHVADIGVVARIAHRRSHREPEQHVRSLAVKILDGTAQAAAEEFEVHTGVDIGVGFPGNQFVTFLREYDGHVLARRFDRIVVHIEVVRDIVVTLRTDRSLEFEHIHPIGSEPRFAVDQPRGARRPEITPAVVGVETRRCVAAVRSVQDDAVVVFVLDTAEITFVVVFRRIGGGILRIHDCTVELVVVDREHVLLGAAERIALQIVEFMADHRAEAVLRAERVVVVEHLLRIDLVGTLVPDDDAAGTGELAVEGIRHRIGTGFVEVRTYIDRRSQVAVQLDVGESRTRESVAVGEGAVQADGLQGIGVGQERTVQSGIHAVAVVVHFIPVVVPHDIAVAVAHVDGVDRGDLVRNGEHVGRTSGARLVLQRLALVVRIAGVGPDFQPFLGLVVGAQTG